MESRGDGHVDSFGLPDDDFLTTTGCGSSGVDASSEQKSSCSRSKREFHTFEIENQIVLEMNVVEIDEKSVSTKLEVKDEEVFCFAENANKQ